MSKHLNSRDFLEIVVEYIQAHGQITLEHDQVLFDEAIKCLINESSMSYREAHMETPCCDDTTNKISLTGASFAKEAYENLSATEKDDFIKDVILNKSKRIFEIPIDVVKQTYMKEVGENCDDNLASKIASQVARDLDFHKSVHQQIREACRSSIDENMLALLTI